MPRNKKIPRASTCADASAASVPDDQVPGGTLPDPGAPDEQIPEPAPARSRTKQARLVEMLEREEGATIDDLIEVTNWLPHTVRSALTGLRKRGRQIERARVNGVSRYTCSKGQAG